MDLINEYLDYIIEVLEAKYGLDRKSAWAIVERSNVYRMIFKDPDYILHYDAEDLADELMR